MRRIAAMDRSKGSEGVSLTRIKSSSREVSVAPKADFASKLLEVDILWLAFGVQREEVSPCRKLN